MRFSSRLPQTLAPNALTEAVARRTREGPPFIDLTESNPTRASFAYPSAVTSALGDARSLDYDPRPFGLPVARAAVAAEYARRGVAIAADRILLTASSSESYSLLFKLLADPGDNVLAPVPSYPLFEHLAALDAVTVRSYALEFHGHWVLDAQAVDLLIDRRTRAVLVVTPNNPTGSCLRRSELRALDTLCAARGVALVGDEVFADYPVARPTSAAVSVLHDGDRPLDCLRFSLGGLSKSVGLPQMKLGWIAAAGPDPAVSAALERLEMIADTYLSVATPVQVALPTLLELGREVREQIADRVLLNDSVLRERAAAAPACRVLPVEGGWSAVIQAPAIGSDESLALRILDEASVLVHPGYFFDFPREGFLVVSLLPPSSSFHIAASRLFDRLAHL